MGEATISVEDYEGGRMFEDAVSHSFYPIDLHFEGGVRPKHLKEGVVPTVPLRTLIPKGSQNLLVAGRCVSSDRLANSALSGSGLVHGDGTGGGRNGGVGGTHRNDAEAGAVGGDPIHLG